MLDTGNYIEIKYYSMTARKKDHIHLADKSRTKTESVDNRFYYEPIIADGNKKKEKIIFDNKHLENPFWISSITGGTQQARTINIRLAKACAEFKIGMALGSCRYIIDNDEHFEDFNLRDIIGPDLPFYANIGICQLEEIIQNKELYKITKLVNKLRVDGIIIHINPIQEFLQIEGDVIAQKPLDTIKHFLEKTKIKTIVKEVGQGMGPKSLKELMLLPLVAIELAAFGGTNFAKIEYIRNNNIQQLEAFINIGHTAEEMIGYINEIKQNHKNIMCENIIISGGINNPLDAFYLMKKCQMNSIIGKANSYLKHAIISYESLKNYIEQDILALDFAHKYLKIK